MLSDDPPGRHRATAHRRPVALFIALGATTALGSSEVPSSPGLDVEAARAVVRRARQSLDGAMPAAERRLDALVRRAEAVTAMERSPPGGRRDAASPEEVWSHALDAAAAAHAALFARRHRQRESWAELEAAAAAAVAEARRQTAAPGLGAREKSLAARAEVSLGLARRLAAEGAFDDARRAASTALDQAAEVAAGWRSLHARFSDRDSLAAWRRMVEETVSASRRSGATALVVDKLARRLDVYASGRRVARLPVELGAQGLRRKLHAGDRATPEGRYRVVEVKTGRQTRYYKALLLDYPSAEDRARYERERRRGAIPPQAGVGGLIEIHGHGGRGRDWTDGCIALTDADMDRLFRYVGVGTPVTIVGTVSEAGEGGE